MFIGKRWGMTEVTIVENRNREFLFFGVFFYIKEPQKHRIKTWSSEILLFTITFQL